MINIIKEKKIELYILLGIIFLVGLLFFNKTIDVWAAHLFFHPENADNFWPEEQIPLWKFFYYVAPFITASVAIPSIIIFILSYIKESFTQYRKKSLFIFLVVALGPGLVINSIFKPYWGRPRPRQIIEFHGQQEYHPFWLKGVARKGMSFPCGHCSVGFMLGAFYFLLRERKKQSAQIILYGSIVLGLLMGLGRMAAGGHFLSDVLWAGLIDWIVIYLLYYFILKIPEDTGNYKINQKAALFSGAILLSLTTLSVLLATPKNKKIEHVWKDKSNFTINLERGDVEVIIIEQPHTVKLVGDIKGFGFPQSEAKELLSDSSYSMIKSGVFTDFEANFKLYLSKDLDGFKLNIQQGGNVIIPATTPKEYHFHSENY